MVAKAKQVLGPGQETFHTALTPRGRAPALQVRPPLADDSNTSPSSKMRTGLARTVSPDNQHSELVGQAMLVNHLPARRPWVFTLDHDSPPSLETSNEAPPPVSGRDKAMQFAGVAEEK